MVGVDPEHPLSAVKTYRSHLERERSGALIRGCLLAIIGVRAPTFGFVALLGGGLAAIAAPASWLPARRVPGDQPVTALKVEWDRDSRRPASSSPGSAGAGRSE